MRKIILSAIGIAFSIISFAQLKFQGSLVTVSGNSSSVDIVIKPTINFTGYLTNVVFTIQIPQGVTQPVIAPTSLSAYFPAFIAIPPVNSGGYTNYGYSATNTSLTTTTTISSATSYPILRLSFTGGPVVPPSDLRLANLANGGPGTLYQFYVEANSTTTGANDYTNYVKMFYGTFSSPSSPFPDEGTGYANYQYTTLSSAPLPLKLLGFAAVKRDKDAYLTWAVDNQDATSSHFEIERSLNGIDFINIGRIAVDLARGSSATYNSTDLNIAAVRASAFIYYRIKQIDKDGRFNYSEIRKVSLAGKGFAFDIINNPVKGRDLKINIQSEENNKGTIKIFDMNGKQFAQNDISWTLGNTDQIIHLPLLSSGTYIASLTTGTEQYQAKFVK